MSSFRGGGGGGGGRRGGARGGGSGFRGGGRGGGGGGGGSGRGSGGVPQPGGAGPALSICNFFTKGTCSRQNCNFMHAINGQFNFPATQRKAVRSIAMLENGTLFTGSVDGMIKMWNLAAASGGPPPSQDMNVGGQVLCLIVRGPFLIWASSVPDPSNPESGITVGSVQALNLATNDKYTCERSESLKYTHPQPVASIDATILGEQLFLITSGNEGMIRMWKLNPAAGKFEPIMELEGHARGVTAVAISGSNLWSGSMDHTVLCWDLNSGSCTRVLTKAQGAHQDAVTCISTFSSDGPEYIISGGMDKKITVFNSATGEVVCSDVHPDIVTAVKAVRDIENNILFVVGLADGRIVVRNANMAVLFTLENQSLHHSGPVQSIEDCGSGYFATAGDDGYVVMWTMPDAIGRITN